MLFTLQIVASCFGALTCRDSNNVAQDWLMAMKQPNGFAYAYRDSSETNTDPMRISPYSLNSSSNFAWGTLQPIFEDKTTKKIAFVFYNDEEPSGKVSSGGAHAKGVIATGGLSSIHPYPTRR
jgi:hypothetical protein